MRTLSFCILASRIFGSSYIVSHLPDKMPALCVDTLSRRAISNNACIMCYKYLYLYVRAEKIIYVYRQTHIITITPQIIEKKEDKRKYSLILTTIKRATRQEPKIKKKKEKKKDKKTKIIKKNKNLKDKVLQSTVCKINPLILLSFYNFYVRIFVIAECGNNHFPLFERFTITRKLHQSLQ